jgi:hypothetical protein
MKPVYTVMSSKLVRRGQAETAVFTQALRDLEHHGLRTPCAATATHS